MDALWTLGGDARVRDLAPRFPELAYTTLMTTLDRLHRKGLLHRISSGRAFAYRPRLSRAEARLRDAIGSLRRLMNESDGVEPVLSFLVDEVTAQDQRALDELERLVRERRRALGAADEESR